MNYPLVSIIFPTFNGWQNTKECLESIARLNYPQDKIEIIIVDNGSTDNTLQKVKEFAKKYSCQFVSGTESPIKKAAVRVPHIRVNSRKPTITLIENRTNLGFSRAVNLGAKKANGEYFLITNNDVVFDKNYFALLVEFLQKEPLAGIVGGKVFYQHSKGKIAFAGARFNFYTGLLRLGKHPNQICKTDWVPGCNMLLRRRVWEEIGGFDEKFFFYFEDLDLCLRAKRAGWRIIYYPCLGFHTPPP